METVDERAGIYSGEIDQNQERHRGQEICSFHPVVKTGVVRGILFSIFVSCDQAYSIPKKLTADGSTLSRIDLLFLGFHCPALHVSTFRFPSNSSRNPPLYVTPGYKSISNLVKSFPALFASPRGPDDNRSAIVESPEGLPSRPTTEWVPRKMLYPSFRPDSHFLCPKWSMTQRWATRFSSGLCSK